MSTATTTEPTTTTHTTTQPTTNPATQTSPNAAQRLRTTMAAVRLAFTWLGVRKTLAPEQRTTAARAFHADRELLSTRRHQLDRGRDQVLLPAGELAGRPARSGRPERRPRGRDRRRQDRDSSPMGFRSVPIGRSSGGVFAFGRGEWRSGAESRAGAGSELSGEFCGHLLCVTRCRFADGSWPA
jgi:hypothetical protein